MKRLLVVGMLSLIALGVVVEQSYAFLFKCLRCHKYSTRICVRPYNAFSPVCYGTITANGCCPLMLHGGGGYPGHFAGNWGGGCFDGGCLPSTIHGGDTKDPNFTPPNPNPADRGMSQFYPSPMPTGPAMIQPTGYYPAYYYGGYPPNPAWGYYPVQPQGQWPAYWYGGR